MQRIVLLTAICLLFIFTIYILQEKSVITTMKYFPIDDQVIFKHAASHISFIEKDNIIEWSVESTSSEEVYLRQDVSLLYENGKFKGVLSKWREQIAQLHLLKRFSQNNNSLLQVISFHHGEIHYPNNRIHSTQKMTSSNLYYVRDEDMTFSFQTPSTQVETYWKEKLNTWTEKQLFRHWNHLIEDLHINHHHYLLIPLTEISTYEDNSLPHFTEAETKKIIGQLWEGLYKNYIVLLANDEMNDTPHYIPLIMLAKDSSHLLIIFELNGQSQKLMQRIS